MPPHENLRLRIGDAERNAVADSLSRHFADGRIDEAELKERLDGVMAAKTGQDLDGFLDDLPHLESDPSDRGAPSASDVPASDPSGAHEDHVARHFSRLWLLAAAALAIVMWGHVFWWSPWLAFPPLAWVVVGVIAFGIFRRRRLIRVYSGQRRCTCLPPEH